MYKPAIRNLKSAIDFVPLLQSSKTDMPIDCHKCIYYYVTWNPIFPHGCRGMGFKSRRYPITEVRSIMNGESCLLFSAKKKKKSQSGEKIGSEDLKQWPPYQF
jgi:hypothetical protein